MIRSSTKAYFCIGTSMNTNRPARSVWVRRGDVRSSVATLGVPLGPAMRLAKYKRAPETGRGVLGSCNSTPVIVARSGFEGVGTTVIKGKDCDPELDGVADEPDSDENESHAVESNTIEVQAMANQRFISIFF